MAVRLVITNFKFFTTFWKYGEQIDLHCEYLSAFGDFSNMAPVTNCKTDSTDRLKAESSRLKTNFQLFSSQPLPANWERQGGLK